MNIKLVSLLVLLGLSFAPAEAHTWPKIHEVEKTIHVDNPDSPTVGLELVVKGSDGRDLYRIACHSGNYEPHNDSEDYSGLIQCYVESTYSKESVSNLLTDTYNQVSDWHNRGRFISQHLESPCSDVPEWGRLRHFRLRGMEITLAISNAKFAPTGASTPHVASYDFEVIVRPMPGATGAIAEPVKIPQPGWFYAEKCPESRSS